MARSRLATLFHRIIAGAPEDMAGMVFGAIIVLAVISAGSQGGTPEPWRLAILAATTAVVLWIGHVYAHALSKAVALGRRLDWSAFSAVARRQAAIPAAAIAPCAALCLGGLGVLAVRSSVWLALALGVATLGVQGLRYARLERLGWAGTAVSVSANVFLGLVIVALKAAVAH
jgi:hypothetical protein